MSEYGGKYAPKKKPWWQPFLPVLGLVMLIVFGGIAYLLSAPLFEFIDSRVAVRLAPQVQFLVAGAIFIVFVLLTAMIYSAFQPKMPKGVSEQDLDKEKKERQKEEAAANRRKKEMQAKMRARNRSQEK